MKLLSYKQFLDNKLNELYVHKEVEDLEDSKFILYKKDLFIFDESTWSETIESLIHDSNLNFDFSNIDDMYTSLNELKEERPDIIIGYISNNTAYIETFEHSHSEHSDDIKKLSQELKMTIKFKYFDDMSGGYDNDQFITRNIEQKKLKDRIFYHGTCLKFLESILSKGLIPTKDTNFSGIDHNNKIFMSLNIEKAVFHAHHAAKTQNSFPIIISFKVPDTSKLIPDYDLTRDVYGDKSDIMKKYNYDKIKTGLSVKRGIGYGSNKDITNKIGIYGYLGRIPASMIGDIWIDTDTLTNHQFEYNREIGEGAGEVKFNEIIDWSEIDKSQILRIISKIEDEYLEELGIEDGEDYWDKEED